MTASNHIATGLVIGTAVSAPAIALPAAVVSHFVLDSLPHYGFPGKDHTSRKFLYILVSDAAVAASLILSVFVLKPDGWLLMLVCGVIAASPDLHWLPRWIDEHKGVRSPPKGWLVRWHANIQKHEHPSNWPWEIVWFCLMLASFAGLAF